MDNEPKWKRRTCRDIKTIQSDLLDRKGKENWKMSANKTCWKKVCYWFQRIAGGNQGIKTICVSQWLFNMIRVSNSIDE